MKKLPTTEDLQDEIVVLTARAELAETDASQAWDEFHGFYLRVAKRAGEPDFATRRHEIAAQAKAARDRLLLWGRRI